MNYQELRKKRNCKDRKITSEVTISNAMAEIAQKIMEQSILLAEGVDVTEQARINQNMLTKWTEKLIMYDAEAKVLALINETKFWQAYQLMDRHVEGEGRHWQMDMDGFGFEHLKSWLFKHWSWDVTTKESIKYAHTVLRHPNRVPKVMDRRS